MVRSSNLQTADRVFCWYAGPEPHQLIVQDDLHQLLDVLPADLGSCLINHPLRGQLIEVVLDLGRRPEARFQGAEAEFLRDEPVSYPSLDSSNRPSVMLCRHEDSALV
eukprot:GHUV01051539.1.p1 GENE.GHUV01051539.1~~GHUV01051539.1.p1  ORF type:complete len:108 (+),score=15.83 GHUV01051539.1:1213-1536(+)